MSSNINTWSDWIDFNESTLQDIPESEGVYMMHSSMKILFIEGASNIRNSIEKKLSHPCISNNTRIRFMKTRSYEKISKELISDYKNRHEGKIPSCMHE